MWKILRDSTHAYAAKDGLRHLSVYVHEWYNDINVLLTFYLWAQFISAPLVHIMSAYVLHWTDVFWTFDFMQARTLYYKTGDTCWIDAGK